MQGRASWFSQGRTKLNLPKPIGHSFTPLSARKAVRAIDIFDKVQGGTESFHIGGSNAPAGRGESRGFRASQDLQQDELCDIKCAFARFVF
jgi:hypothetical protein